MRAIKRPGLVSTAFGVLLLAGAVPLRREGPLAVPRTGQTACWDESGKTIDCAGTGQDGELREGASVAPRFVDNGDGTVTDKLTSLIWLKVPSCLDPMNWTDALARASKVGDGCCCGLSDGSRAGDWRMPNIKELQSLVDYGEFSPAFPHDHPFTGLKAGHYWSSTTMKGNPDRAFSLYLSFGVAGRNLKIEEYLLWPVRNSRSTPRRRPGTGQ